MNPQELLLTLQFSSLVLTLMMALLLLFTRIHARNTTRNYEESRWLLFTALILFAVHYALQMKFGFRAQGDDVGAVINILFYTPSIYMISYTVVNLVSRKRYLRLYVISSIVCLVLMAACFLTGLFTYHSLHMPNALYAMGGVFSLNMALLVFYPLREMRRARKQIENETADDLSNFNLYMFTGTLLLLIMAIFIPVIIFSLWALAIIGPLYWLVFYFYIVSFMALGFNISSVGSVIGDEDASQNQSEEQLPQEQHLEPEKIARIEEAIARWRASRGYSLSNLSVLTMANQLGIPKRDLSRYISEELGMTFRVWLSNVRIEEVKNLLLKNDSFSNESIALECGFSSRSWMQEKFKASTGMTPNEWRETQKKSNN